MHDDMETLRAHGVNPSAQRIAVAGFVLHTNAHPSADEVWQCVKERFPMLSRATVYNTLNLFVRKGLVKQFALQGGKVVFDRNTTNHHHFIDEETGAISDIPWGELRIEGFENPHGHLHNYFISEYQVVVRGKKKS